MLATDERELSWLEKHGTPRYPRETSYRALYDHNRVHPKTQVENLQDYLKIVPLIVPEEPELNRPVIRRPDLSPNNIFVSESGTITGIINWQYSAALPLFF